MPQPAWRWRLRKAGKTLVACKTCMRYTLSPRPAHPAPIARRIASGNSAAWSAVQLATASTSTHAQQYGKSAAIKSSRQSDKGNAT